MLGLSFSLSQQSCRVVFSNTFSFCFILSLYIGMLDFHFCALYLLVYIPIYFGQVLDNSLHFSIALVSVSDPGGSVFKSPRLDPDPYSIYGSGSSKGY